MFFTKLRAIVRGQINDPLNQGWATLFSGTLARLALGFVSSILIARGLGPVMFGLFATLGVVASLGGALLDVGLSATVVRRVAALWPANQALATRRALAFLQLRLFMVGLLILVSLLIAVPLSALIPGHPAAWLVILALLGVAVTSLSGSLSALLQATGAFRSLTLVLMANSALTTLLAVVLQYVGQLTIATALGILGIGTSFVSLILGWWWLLLRPAIMAELREASQAQWAFLKAEARELLRFGVWVWLSNALAMLASSLDVLLVGRWLPQAAIGQYALASNLAGKADSINQSLHAVLLPAASQLADQQAIRGYLRRSFARSALLSTLLLPLFPFAEPVIALFYGNAFRPAAFIFQLLLGVAMLDIWLTPFLLLVYAANRPRLLAGADALRTLTLVGSAAWLIPFLSLPGAPLARLCARLAGALLIMVQLRRLIQAPDTPAPAEAPLP